MPTRSDGGHSEIEIKDLKVPADNLLGGEGNGFNMGQHRLAYGRLRHGMHNVAKAQRALDMAVGAHHQALDLRPAAVRPPGACSSCSPIAPSELYIGRLMLLHIAYKAEKGLDIRQENSIAKIFHGAHGAQGDRHRDPAARRARLQPGYAAGRTGTPRCARSGWSTVRTRCTAGRSARTSSRRSSEHGTTASAVGGDLL